ELLSFAVGCMFGRFALEDFSADRDNVIPVTEGDWFDDDIASRFREFLKVAFGERHLQDNLAFVEETLGKSIRQYFLKDFYADHVKRYKNRPIYWMFSSRPDGKGKFNALIYLHRYTPATLNHLLNSYLREFQEKVRATIVGLEHRTDAAAAKQVDALRPVVTECEDYERNILYPLALRQPEIDLDDGVLVNYLRFGRAVVRLKALEAKRSDVETWTWPVNPLRPEDA
ncbi:MAG: class I SAM-dependent DNA methyltransferase, partial [Bifidobacteriaceae bacterium]|nr:class I SAM-dependent DNA methyltransferase [Bifidobacteriaceae bacterium]